MRQGRELVDVEDGADDLVLHRIQGRRRKLLGAAVEVLWAIFSVGWSFLARLLGRAEDGASQGRRRRVPWARAQAAPGHAGVPAGDGSREESERNGGEGKSPCER
nr:unnamed protein product [Digitaria exilis]